MKKQLMRLVLTLVCTTTLFQPIQAGPVKTAIRGLGRLTETAIGLALVVVGGCAIIVPWTSRHSEPGFIVGGTILGIPAVLIGALMAENGVEGFNKILNKKDKKKHHHHHTEKVDLVVHTK